MSGLRYKRQGRKQCAPVGLVDFHTMSSRFGLPGRELEDGLDEADGGLMLLGSLRLLRLVRRLRLLSVFILVVGGCCYLPPPSQRRLLAVFLCA